MGVLWQLKWWIVEIQSEILTMMNWYNQEERFEKRFPNKFVEKSLGTNSSSSKQNQKWFKCVDVYSRLYELVATK